MGAPRGTQAGLPRALGQRVDPYLGLSFLVEIEGLVVGGFSKVEGLEATIETQDFTEGGRNGFVHKILKGTSSPPLVLSRGLTDSDVLWRWFERTRQGILQRRNGTLMLLDTRGEPALWWTFIDALPVKWSGPQFDASSDGQVAIERVELVHRGLSRPARREGQDT